MRHWHDFQLHTWKSLAKLRVCKKHSFSQGPQRLQSLHATKHNWSLFDTVFHLRREALYANATLDSYVESQMRA